MNLSVSKSSFIYCDYIEIPWLNELRIKNGMLKLVAVWCKWTSWPSKVWYLYFKFIQYYHSINIIFYIKIMSIGPRKDTLSSICFTLEHGCFMGISKI